MNTFLATIDSSLEELQQSLPLGKVYNIWANRALIDGSDKGYIFQIPLGDDKGTVKCSVDVTTKSGGISQPGMLIELMVGRLDERESFLKGIPFGKFLFENSMYWISLGQVELERVT